VSAARSSVSSEVSWSVVSGHLVGRKRHELARRQGHELVGGERLDARRIERRYLRGGERGDLAGGERRHLLGGQRVELRRRERRHVAGFDRLDLVGVEPQQLTRRKRVIAALESATICSVVSAWI
jgi:hypothetical protein